MTDQFIGKSIENQTYGVPTEIFSRHGSGEFTTASGRTLTYTIYDKQIDIRDMNTDLHFLAQRSPTNPHSVDFSIETKRNEVRHPDLFAAELLAYTLTHHWPQTTEVVARWCVPSPPDVPLSDNFTAFKQHPEYTTNPLEAAAETWTGQQLARLNFHPDNIKFHPSKPEKAIIIKVTFKRQPPTSSPELESPTGSDHS